MIPQGFPVEPPLISMTITTFERLLPGYDHMSDPPVHLCPDEAVLTTIGYAHGSHTIGDGPIPIEVLPIPTKQFRNNEIIVYDILGLLAFHKLEGKDFGVFIINASERFG